MKSQKKKPQKSESTSSGLDFDKDIAKFTPRQLDCLAAGDSGEKKYILYGGCLGGGKSFLLRWNAVRRLMYLYTKYKIPRICAMLACED